MPKYHYISSPEFVQQLKFDYVETYSFQRNRELQEHFALIKLKQQESKLTVEQERRLGVLSSYPREEGLLVDVKGSSARHAIISGHVKKERPKWNNFRPY